MYQIETKDCNKSEKRVQMKLLKEILLDIVNGFKKMFVGFGIFLVSVAVVWGLISGALTIFGDINFTWWNVPCWVIDLCVVAGCIGQKHY